MDLTIKRVAKQSTLSGVAFDDGEEVECILYRSEEGELERADLRSEERPEWSAPGPVFCRWRHRFKQAADSNEEVQSLATAEELFLALIEEIKNEQNEADDELKRKRLVLLNLIVLMLERKRVLKPLNGQAGHYRYMPEKKDLLVPLIDLEPLEIAGLLSELDALL